MKLRSCNDSELIKIISELSEIQAMRVTVKSCVSSGFIVGASAALGGFLFGPRGVAAGSIIAGIATSAANEGKFRSVPDILMNDLSKDQKKRLADSIRNLLTKEKIMTVAALTVQMTSESGIKEALETIIISFLKSTFNYDI